MAFELECDKMVIKRGEIVRTDGVRLSASIGDI